VRIKLVACFSYGYVVVCNYALYSVLFYQVNLPASEIREPDALSAIRQFFDVFFIELFNKNNVTFDAGVS